MELANKSLLTIEGELEDGVSMNLNKSDEIDLLGNSQDGIQQAVIIYDQDSQEAVVKIVSSSESSVAEVCNQTTADADNVITFCTSPLKCKVEGEDISSEDINNDNMVDLKSDDVNKSEEVEEDEDDDETIATFVTSTGQQLALYAVEDSEEIYAVALYDETGKPPTNFNFLMKADVERLIGEGAVKTMKKPPVQASDEEVKTIEKNEETKLEKHEETKTVSENIKPILENVKSIPEKKEFPLKKMNEIKKDIVEVPAVQKAQEIKSQVERKPVNKTIKSYNISSNKTINETKPSTPVKTNSVVKNTTQRQVDVKKEPGVAYVISRENESYVLDPSEEFDSDAEIIEQSTVQYILCDGDPSDSELTFDELQASLQSFKLSKSMPILHKTKLSDSQNVEKKDTFTKFSPLVKSTPKISSIKKDSPIKKENPTTVIYRTYKSPKKTKTTNNLLQTHRKIKKEIEDEQIFSDFSIFDDGHNSSDEVSKDADKQNSAIPENSPGIVKVKRSRKQQLTVVNRTDSEIIIQPASIFSEEEEEPVMTKKRGRRKKKLLADPDYNPRKPPKKTKRSHRSVEVIELDIDESERSNVLEITLDGNKEKGSSDKENDIISLDDSDEDAGSSKGKKIPVMQCSHCMRNFRNRSALGKHLQSCPKTFKCKSCNQDFDMAVSLARHVRVVHSPRKRGRPSKAGWSRDDESDTSESDDSTDESYPEPEQVPRKRGRPPNKKNVAKDQSRTQDNDLKLDSSSEPQSEPRRRGRPPGKKNVIKEKSISPDLEERSTGVTERSSEPRKRGRPRKRSLSKDEVIKDLGVEKKTENVSESFVQVPKKRGRPSKKIFIKEEPVEVLEPAEGDGNLAEPTSASPEKTEKEPLQIPKKRDRLIKSSFCKDDKVDSPETSDKIEKPAELKTKSDADILIEQLENDKDSEDDFEDLIKKRKSIEEAEDRLISSAIIWKSENVEESLVELEKHCTSSKDPVYEFLEKTAGTPNTEDIEENATECSMENRRKSRVNLDKQAKGDVLKDRSKSPDLDNKGETKESSVECVEEQRKSDKSTCSNSELKVESKTDAVTEPRKRGRPAKDRSAKNEPLKERSQSPHPRDNDENSEASLKSEETNKSSKTESEEQVDNIVDSQESRKRGRPIKEKPVNNESLKKTLVSLDTEDSAESVVESLLESRTRNKSAKDVVSKNEPLTERSTSPVSESKVESTTSSLEPRKSGRLVKDKLTKDETSKDRRASLDVEDEDESIVTSTEDKVESIADSSEVRKRGRLIKEKSTKDESVKDTSSLPLEKNIKSSVDSAETRKRGRPVKDKPVKDEPTTSEISEAKLEINTESTSEARRKGRGISGNSEADEIMEVEAIVSQDSSMEEDKKTIQKKTLSSNRTWKVKKLNCPDCSKWFSSATALATHRLQHRTKKSGHRTRRCPICKKLVPSELYTKHQVTVHRKPSPGKSLRRTHTRQIVKSTRMKQSGRTLRSSTQ